MTALAGGTLTVTVLDDSHTHDTRYYTETEVNSLQTAQDTALQTYANNAASSAVSAHTGAGTDAHDATAISFIPPSVPPLNLFLTATDVQNAIIQSASEIDGRISAGDTDAIIAAINAWLPGDTTITNSNVLSTGLIVSDAIASGAVVAGKLAAGSIDASSLFVDGVITGGKINANTTITVSIN
jgi:hypothetical protein